MIVHRRALRTPHRRATDTLSSVITLSSSLRTATVAGAAVLALGLSGCSLNSPVQTDVDYPAADGVGLSLGDVQLRNVAVVATTKDGPGTLIGQVVTQGERWWVRDAQAAMFESAILSEKTALDTARAGLLADIRERGTVYGG